MGAADIEIDVQESGGWVLKLGSAGLGLSSENVSSLANRFALALPPLAIDPAMVGLASNSGIQHLALVKQGNESTVFINGIPATEVALSDAAVSKVAAEFVPELEGLISWANSANLAVVLNFPANGAGERYVLDLGQAVAAAATADTRANQIGLGATISPDGKIVSIGGIAPADLGLDLGAIDMSWMQSFGIDRLGLNQLDLAVDANGLTVSSNGDEWVSMAWDADYVAQNAGALGKMSGFVIDQSVVDLAVDWLKDTEIHVGAYLADESAEGAPVVSIGRPVSASTPALCSTTLPSATSSRWVRWQWYGTEPRVKLAWPSTPRRCRPSRLRKASFPQSAALSSGTSCRGASWSRSWVTPSSVLS